MTTEPCPAQRYAPSQPCSDPRGVWKVVYRSAKGDVLDEHWTCFVHGLAEVDRHAAAAGIATAELVKDR